MDLRKNKLPGLLVGLTTVMTIAACGGSAQPVAANTNTESRAAAAAAVADTTNTAAAAKQTVGRPAGWSEASHSKDADPDYAVVFPQDRVNQITITIDPPDYEAMRANMVELLGEKGAGGRPGGGFGVPGDRQPPGNAPRPSGDSQPLLGDVQQPFGDAPQPPADMPQPPTGEGRGGSGGPGGFGGGDMTPENPMWVSATITFNGETWTNVGVRYKGNSTLTRSWQSGSDKLPLKLDFDQYEDEHPEIEDQRFYGFKQLSLANNLNDASNLKDALAYDIMGAAGLVAPETAFYEVFLDTGDGPVSLGLYTVVEVVDDTVIDRSFDDSDGNIYEAEGTAASFAEGTDGQIEDSYQKENNEAEADWSDIQALYDVLHSARRTSDPVAWRASLEEVFDVDTFLEWLAINSVIQDWDAYGSMSHNYYLYHDPITDKLVWIAWDHNEAFSSGGRGRGTASLDKENVGDTWPLIRYLLDDPTYKAKYVEYLRSSIADAFVAKAIAEKVDALAKLVQPYAEKGGNAQAFATAVAQLKTFGTERVGAVETFLAQQEP